MPVRACCARVYEELKAEILRRLEPRPLTREERISWAYSNAVLSNPDVTREMVERAVDRGSAAGSDSRFVVNG